MPVQCSRSHGKSGELDFLIDLSHLFADFAVMRPTLETVSRAAFSIVGHQRLKPLGEIKLLVLAVESNHPFKLPSLPKIQVKS